MLGYTFQCTTNDKASLLRQECLSLVGLDITAREQEEERITRVEEERNMCVSCCFDEYIHTMCLACCCDDFASAYFNEKPKQSLLSLLVQDNRAPLTAPHLGSEPSGDD